MKSSEIHFIGPFEGFEFGESDLDKAGNKVFYSDPDKALEYNYIPVQMDPDIIKLSKKLSDLALKIEENERNFAEIERTIRDVQFAETHQISLKLIIQNLKYWSSNCRTLNMHFVHIVMTSTTPLAFLGFVAQILLTPCCVCNIVCDESTAAVCSLFVSLCRDVGLDEVSLLLLRDPIIMKATTDAMIFPEILGFDSGCMGIIMKKSNMEKALDTCLTSTGSYPWRLRRLVVHENVFENVKKMLAMKCGQSDSKFESYKKKSTEAFAFKNKLFLFESSEEELRDEHRQIVVVESYGTNEELTSMIESHDPFCISLWSDDHSETNEIAFNVDTSIIWVNDFATFAGPEIGSQTFFSKIALGYSVEVLKKRYEDKLDDLRERQQAWLKMNVIKRRNILISVIDKFQLENRDVNASSCVNDLKCNVDWTTDKVIDINNGKNSFIAIQEPVGVLALPCCTDDVDYLQLSFLKSIVLGNGIILDECRPMPLMKMFRDEGLPVMFVDFYEDDSRVGTAYMIYKTRAIWTTY